jgi:SAM-dependent methyltransferase
MKIINAQIHADLAAGRPLRLNLGSGGKPMAGYYNVDLLELPGVDVVANLNESLTAFPDNCVEAVSSRHTLEHVDRLLELLAELHRVTRPEARLEITVPHFSNPYGYSDPTHVRFFGLYSFFYFCDTADQPRRKVPNFYMPQRFRIETIRCRLLKASIADKVLQTLLEPLINRSIAWLDWYERRLCRWLPISDIRYVLRTKKEPSPPLARAG